MAFQKSSSKTTGQSYRTCLPLTPPTPTLNMALANMAEDARQHSFQEGYRAVVLNPLPMQGPLGSTWMDFMGSVKSPNEPLGTRKFSEAVSQGKL